MQFSVTSNPLTSKETDAGLSISGAKVDFPMVHFNALVPDSAYPIIGSPTVLLKVRSISDSGSQLPKNVVELAFQSPEDLADKLFLARTSLPLMAVSSIPNEEIFQFVTWVCNACILITPVPTPRFSYDPKAARYFLDYYVRVIPEQFGIKLPKNTALWVRRSKLEDPHLLTKSISELRYAIAILRYFQNVPYDLKLSGDRLVFSNHPAFLELVERWNFSDFVRRWNKQSIVLLKQSRSAAAELRNASFIRISPELVDAITTAMTVANVPLEKAPFREMPDEIRLGILDYYNTVQDKQSNEIISVVTETQTITEKGYALKMRDDGSVETHRVRWTKKKLEIILPKARYSEDRVAEFLARYKIPTVNDVSKFTEYEAAQAYIDELEESMLKPNGQSLRRFQKEDLARLLTKGFGIYAADPGLGKTIIGWMFALAAMQFHKTAARVLIVAPQDIVPHWISEAEKFFGSEFVSDICIVRNVQDAIALYRVAKLLPKDIPLFVITYYEALRHALPQNYNRKHGLALNLDGDQALEARERYLSRKQKCPICGRFPPSEKDGSLCWPDCPDPTPYAFRSRDAAFYLKKFIKNGILIVDEATLAKSADSLRGIATRRLITAKCRLLLTGTPIKNTISDIPTLLQLTAKPKSTAFPFPAEEDGVRRFARQFLVIEQDLETGKVKTVPEATDIQRLHLLLSGLVLRRSKDQTGEPIPPLDIKVHEVPMSGTQIAWYKAWADDALLAAWAAIAKGKAISQLEKMLMLFSRLMFVVCHPTSKTAIGDPFPLSSLRRLPEPTELTPKNLKTLELVKEALRSDAHVVLYAQTIGVFRFLSEMLERCGIKIHHTVKVTKKCEIRSLPPSERVAVIEKFRREGGVLLASISAMAYGHDLPFCNHCVIHSLPVAYDQFVQAINRIHRLTSQKPVTAHVIITPQSIDHYLFDLLLRKHMTSKQLLGSTIENFGTITADELAKIAQQAAEHVDEIPVE